MVVLNDDQLFETCLINPKITQNNTIHNSSINSINDTTIHNDTKTPLHHCDDNDNIEINDNIDNNDNLKMDKSLDDTDITIDATSVYETDNSITLNNLSINENTSQINSENIILDIEELNEDIEEKSDELMELNKSNFTFEDNLETMQLKKPNQVYFELYKQARKKAKECKKNAIIAYLEAKNIKKTYMVDNVIDSDSDFDAEIDEVSESELDNFD